MGCRTSKHTIVREPIHRNKIEPLVLKRVVWRSLSASSVLPPLDVSPESIIISRALSDPTFHRNKIYACVF
jgi:hypothetical protein